MRILFVLLCSVFLYACSDKTKSNDDKEVFEDFESIKGEESTPVDLKRNVLLTIKSSPNATILIEQSIRGTILSDSVFADSLGLFSAEFQMDRLGFYRTSTSGLPAALLIIDSDSIFVDMTVGDKDFALIGNSKESLYFLEYQKIASKYARRFDKVRSLKGDEVAIYLSRRAEIKDYIKRTAPSFSALNAINEFYNENDLPFLLDVVNIFETSEEAMIYAKPLVEGVKKLAADAKQSPTKLGTVIDDFELKNTLGITTELSQVKGKVILLDFWASWCRPCRQENPNVKRVYSKYKNKGLEILSISTDTDLDAWKKAIEQDGMQWNHMIDDRNPSKNMASKYQVNAIPFMLLLDENYKIIAKNLRGIELEVKVAELLGK